MGIRYATCGRCQSGETWRTTLAVSLNIGPTACPGFKKKVGGGSEYLSELERIVSWVASVTELSRSS